MRPADVTLFLTVTPSLAVGLLPRDVAHCRELTTRDRRISRKGVASLRSAKSRNSGIRSTALIESWNRFLCN